MLTKRITLPLWLLTGILLTGCAQQASDEKTKPPTLADSFQGKRIHFQLGTEEGHQDEFFVQLGDNNQLTVGENKHAMTIPYLINGDSMMVGPTEKGEAIEMKFSKSVFSEGDQVSFIQHHLKDDNLQALVDSADESTVKKTTQGTIVKIEAASPIPPSEVVEDQSKAKPVANEDSSVEASSVEDNSPVTSEPSP